MAAEAGTNREAQKCPLCGERGEYPQALSALLTLCVTHSFGQHPGKSYLCTETPHVLRSLPKTTLILIALNKCVLAVLSTTGGIPLIHHILILNQQSLSLPLPA